MLVERKTVLPLLCSVEISLILLAGVSFGMGSVEFTYAAWTKSEYVVPAICDVYRRVYCYIWLLPLIWGGLAGVLLRKKECDLGELVWLLALAIVFSVSWALFTVLSLYLCNQTFVA